MSQLLRTLSRDLIISSHLFSSLWTQRSQNNSPQAEPSPQKHSVITSLYLILKISFLILIFFFHLTSLSVASLGKSEHLTSLGLCFHATMASWSCGYCSPHSDAPQFTVTHSHLHLVLWMAWPLQAVEVTTPAELSLGES